MLILGGYKSGKSALVRSICKEYTSVLYLAVTLSSDSGAYFQHVRSKPVEWDILEEPVELAASLRRFAADYSLVVLDDVSVWLSNVITLKMNAYYEIDCVIEVLRTLKNKLVVSRELGLGIMSTSALVYKYVGLLNSVNQLLAKTLSSVYFVIAGQAIKIKG
ncbi:bifunctional adenosylcobinamide kinase/adenosylcobinamide-phosphate guanylyltransferase [Candidatus Hodgkinia cicadicola]